MAYRLGIPFVKASLSEFFLSNLYIYNNVRGNGLKYGPELDVRNTYSKLLNISLSG